MMSRTYAKYSNDIFIRGSFRAEGFRRIVQKENPNRPGNDGDAFVLKKTLSYMCYVRYSRKIAHDLRATDTLESRYRFIPSSSRDFYMTFCNYLVIMSCNVYVIIIFIIVRV